MNRHNIDPETFEAWAEGEIRNKNSRKPMPEHGNNGEGSFNVLGIMILIVVVLILINVPTVARLVVAHGPDLIEAAAALLRRMGAMQS